jgi:hypothetical protein
MLEYQPKCRDFMASIDATDRVVRTDRLSATVCADLVTATIEGAPAIATAQSGAVTRLRERLQREAGRLVEVISRTEP